MERLVALLHEQGLALSDKVVRRAAGRSPVRQLVLVAPVFTFCLTLLGVVLHGHVLGTGFLVTYIPLIAALAYAGGQTVGVVAACSSIFLTWWFLIPRPISFQLQGIAAIGWFSLAAITTALQFGSAREIKEKRETADRSRLHLAAIVESSDDAIFAKTLDGIILTWNAGAERLYGYTPDEVMGRSVLMLAPAEHSNDIPEILARLGKGEVIQRYETIRVKKDGTRFDVSLTISPVKDTSGRIIGASTVARDVTDRKRAERAQQFLAEASVVLGGSLDVGATLDALAHLVVPTLADWCTIHLVQDDGGLHRIVTVHADPAKVAVVRELEQQYPADPQARHGVLHVVHTGKGELYSNIDERWLTGVEPDPIIRDTMRGSHLRSAMIVPLIARNRTLGVVTLAAADPGRRYDASDLAVAKDLAERAGLAVDNARLHEAERDARRIAERVSGRIARLQALTAALSEALTPQDVGEVTLDHLIEELGAGAAAMCLRGEGTAPMTLVAAAGYSPEMTERWFHEPERVEPLMDALRVGHVVWFPSWSSFVARYPEAVPPSEPVRQGARAAIPLMLHGHAVGALYLNFGETRHLTADELDFMLTLGRQCAQAAERARLYAHEHQVAATLQQALLPTSLPQIPGIHIDAVYRAGVSEADVGGDWYDVLPLPDGRVMLTIGDVVGRGLGAAVTMGQLRQAIRAAALEGRSPAEALALASRLLRVTVAGQETTTAIVGVLDLLQSTFTYTTAGHPPPLLVVDGRVEPVPSGGLPLGFLGEGGAPQWTIDLPLGSLLVLYTDGLIEFRRDPIAGLAALEAAVEQVWQDPGSRPAQAILDALDLREAPDDVAVVTVRLDSVPLERVDITVPAEPNSLAVVRHTLQRLARAISLDDASAFALMVTVGEAVNNVIEHAYGLTPGTATVRAWRDGDVLRGEVADEGRWRAPMPGSRGGRGLHVMRVFVDSLEIVPTTTGTRVVFAIALPESAQMTEHTDASLSGMMDGPDVRVTGNHRAAREAVGDHDFAVRLHDGVPIIEINGDVDLANVERFISALERATGQGTGPVLVSWSPLAYVDSHGIHALVQVGKRLESIRRALFVVVPVGSPLQRLVERVALGTIARIFGSLEQAVLAALAWETSGDPVN